MKKSRRVTLHNGRSGSKGIFRSGHNDRSGNFAADHVDEKLSRENIYRSIGKFQNFEEAELAFYHSHFKKSLAAQNVRYIDQRHLDRCRTMKDLYFNARSCPEESIFQIGSRDNEKLDRELLDKIILEQLRWEEKTFPQIKYLDYALHVDEPDAADHVHARKVWIGHDKENFEIPSERAALKEMNVPLPMPGKKEGRYNNRKMTYTKMCREHLQELCQKYGIEIEVNPKAKSKSGRSLDQLKTETLRNEIADLTKQKEALTTEIEVRGSERSTLKALEKAAKEVPVTKGLINKELIGYTVSKSWVNEALRLAEIGVSAAGKIQDNEMLIDDLKRDLDLEKLRNKHLQEDVTEAEAVAEQRLQALRDVQKEAAPWLNAPDQERISMLRSAREYGDGINRALVAYAVADRQLHQARQFDAESVQRAMSDALAFICQSDKRSDQVRYVKDCLDGFMQQAKQIVTKGIAQPARTPKGSWFPPPSSTNYSRPASSSLIARLLNEGCEFPTPHFDNSPDFDLMSPEEIEAYFRYADDWSL